MRRVKGLVLALVVVASVSVFADDDEFVLVKPEICNHVTWTDWEYWYYSCYSF